MTDQRAEAQKRAADLATRAYPDFERRAAFEVGYLTRFDEDVEPEADDVVLKCYYSSGTWDIVLSRPSRSMARWVIGQRPELVSWAEVLSKSYVRRVRMVES